MNSLAIGASTKDWAESNELKTYYFSELESTNSYAKENYYNLDYPSLVITDFQSKGRGRGTKTWQAAKSGHSLYSTWCFKSKKAFHYLASVRVGLALYRSLADQYNVSIKPPNDIYFGNKKLAGILVEAINENDSFLFAGIGMNVISAPDNLDRACYLNNNIQQEEWFLFLNKLNQHLISTPWHLSSLDELEQGLLSEAIKRFDDWKGSFISIDRDANLIFKDKVVAWNEL